MEDFDNDHQPAGAIAEGLKMNLSDIDVYELVRALRRERSAWIDGAKEENRQTTEAEKITICVLAALERALGDAAIASEKGADIPAKFADAPGEKGET